MSAQQYLYRLIDEGRTDRGHHRSSLRTTSPTRLERLRRVLEQHRAH